MVLIYGKELGRALPMLVVECRWSRLKEPGSVTAIDFRLTRARYFEKIKSRDATQTGTFEKVNYFCRSFELIQNQPAKSTGPIIGCSRFTSPVAGAPPVQDPTQAVDFIRVLELLTHGDGRGEHQVRHLPLISFLKFL